MKKCLKFLSLIIAIVFVSGCGNDKEFTKTCTLTSTDPTGDYKLETVYEIYGKGKIADKVILNETVTSDDEETLDYFKEYLEDTYNDINNTYGGYTIDVNIKDNKVISKTTIDYHEMDLKKYVEDNSIMKNYVDSNNNMLVDGLISTYKALGATCE